MVFNALHRWLSWKSFAQLPKRTASSSTSSLRDSLAGGAASAAAGLKTHFPLCTEDVLQDLLCGDPWEDCDELAAEDMIDWLADAMQYPRTAGAASQTKTNPTSSVIRLASCETFRPLPAKGFSDEVKSDPRLTEVSTCTSLHSRLRLSPSQSSISSDCNITWYSIPSDCNISWCDALEHESPTHRESDYQPLPPLGVGSPIVNTTPSAGHRHLVEVVSADFDLSPRGTSICRPARDLSKIMGSTMKSDLARPIPSNAPCNCGSCAWCEGT